MCHISAPHRALDDTVFVEDKADGMSWFAVMPWAEAIAQGREIIRCFCGEPAAQIDHYYPTYHNGNLCAAHIANRPEGWRVCAGEHRYLKNSYQHYMRAGRSLCWKWTDSGRHNYDEQPVESHRVCKTCLRKSQRKARA